MANNEAHTRPAVPADCRGYALFGTGRYILNHTSAPVDPQLGAEVIVTLATDKDREGGRKIGESRDTDPDAPAIQPGEMVIRMGFLVPEAIDALEDQLICLRRENFPATQPLAVRAAADAKATGGLNCAARGNEECMAYGACGEAGRCVRAIAAATNGGA